MAVQSFKDLIAWQKAMDLTEAVYLASSKFPAQERFGLTTQLRRAAVTIPGDIAEGQGRGPGNDFVRMLLIARGSTQEVETLVILAQRLGFLPQEEADRLSVKITEVSKLISGLLRSIQH